MPQVMERGWVSKAPRLRHVAPFDGIRGFGVVGVMAGHALPFATLSFSAIVDVFFVKKLPVDKRHNAKIDRPALSKGVSDGSIS